MNSTKRPSRSGPRDRGLIARLRQWRLQTHGRTVPGMVWLVISRFAILFFVFMFYSWFRKTYFQRPDDLAYANALDIIELQERLGIAVTNVEIPLQRWILENPALIDFFNVYYRQFKPALYVCALLCLLLAPMAFHRILRVFLLTTLIAFPMYALYPLAPPRLMQPFGFDFVDTLAVFGNVQSTAEGAGGANQFAAMPSMHIGWTAVATLWLAAAIPWRRVGAILGSIHLILMGFTVVVTGNHYVLDIVAGLLVTATAIVVARSLPDSFPFAPANAALAGVTSQQPGRQGHSSVPPGSGRQKID